MSATSSIAWTGKTWGPVLGCQKVGPGCDHCYAIRTVHRLAHNPHPKIGPLYQGLTRREAGEIDWTGAVITVPDRLTDPFEWKTQQRVFVSSQSDLFHWHVPEEFVARVFAVMALTPRHTYQILTKRPLRMRSILSSREFAGAVDRIAAGISHDNGLPCPDEIPWPLPNVWIGASVEDQQRADLRIPALLDTPAAVRWVSIEPMLGAVDLDEWLWREDASACSDPGCCSSLCPSGRLDWVVIGAESGPDARPMDLAWAQGIVEQCRYACVPVFAKQLPTGRRGRVTQNVATFPEPLRAREYPHAHRAEATVRKDLTC